MKRVTVIGGGLGGLIAAIEFARNGIPCTVAEKKHYPFHRVCGEYISNEVESWLCSQHLYPTDFNPPQISKLQLSSIDGKSMQMDLEMGGFGISRYSFDHFLYQHAVRAGVEFIHEEVTNVRFANDLFTVNGSTREWTSDVVVGAFGKRSKIDHALNRSFIKQRSPYVGVKYHVAYGNPDELISLHNFPGGYCGMSNIEDGKTTLCYLVHRDQLKLNKSIPELERNVLQKNPMLKRVFNESRFLFDKPEVINEISFATKEPVIDHMLMVGDAAGMIAPLCGNGMAMAIQSARLMVGCVVNFTRSGNRITMENEYASIWRSHFAWRLWRGRQIQQLFGKELTSRIAISLVLGIPPLGRMIVRSTHGKVF